MIHLNPSEVITHLAMAIQPHKVIFINSNGIKKKYYLLILI